MKRTGVLSAGAVLLVFCSAGWADLAPIWGGKTNLEAAFSGFTSVAEVGVSGAKSSYDTTRTGTTRPATMVTFEDARVSYPGVGTVPSPGGPVGAQFDEGALGVKVAGGNLVIQVATAFNPQTGVRYNNTYYGQGDIFITVDDSDGVSQFALLNAWPGQNNAYYTLNGGYFAQAQSFHTGIGGSGINLQGHLVSLTADTQVLRYGGTAAYTPSYAGGVGGLDYRAFAQGGTDVGDAGLPTPTLIDGYWVQTWDFDLNWLSLDPGFTLGLHVAPSCGNDQIGLVTAVPVPGAVILGLAGFGTVGLLKRRQVGSKRLA